MSFYATNSPIRWYDLLKNHVGDVGAYRCPTFTLGTRGYGTNLHLCGWTSSVNINTLLTPASTSMFTDAAQCNSTVAGNTDPEKWVDHASGSSDWQWTPPTPYGGGATYYTNTGGNETRRPQARHNRGLNIGYCDGHAEWMPITVFLGPMLDGWPYGDRNNSWDNK